MNPDLPHKVPYHLSGFLMMMVAIVSVIYCKVRLVLPHRGLTGEPS